jgi:CTP:molybdopterin cytidylyltransferase MocA
VADQALGVILGGGRGERFGVPKAVAALPDGRSFLAACAATHRVAGLATSVVTLPPGLECPIPPGVIAVRLDQDGLTMFDSLRLALTVAGRVREWQAAVVHPVDHPLVAGATIAALVAALLAGSGLEAVLPSCRGKHGHPVALRRAACARIVAGLEPGPTLRDVLHRCRRGDVVVADRGVIGNCNTPERLAAAWEIYCREGAGAG